MKKLILIAVLSFFITSESHAQARRVKVEIGSVVVGGIAGGAFALAGVLQKPDERWVPDPKGTFYNQGKMGSWRKETFWEDRNRVAAVFSGLFIFGASVAITF